ncbi:hypothetical protein EV360DRAFT_88971 [Lentinula raphanica]|nr:hypothetical protein EV360DRAFT_88971 [Lentinula raphanica]
MTVGRSEITRSKAQELLISVIIGSTSVKAHIDTIDPTERASKPRKFRTVSDTPWVTRLKLSSPLPKAYNLTVPVNDPRITNFQTHLTSFDPEERLSNVSLWTLQKCTSTTHDLTRSDFILLRIFASHILLQCPAIVGR